MTWDVGCKNKDDVGGCIGAILPRDLLSQLEKKSKYRMWGCGYVGMRVCGLRACGNARMQGCGMQAYGMRKNLQGFHSPHPHDGLRCDVGCKCKDF
jgi:hypothetical protein